MPRTSYTAIFAPESVAVIGASDRDGSVGAQVFANLRQEYKGQVYAVNPNHRKVGGLPSYASILDVPDPVDAAVIAVRRELVPAIIADCGRHGVKGAVVVAAGPFPDSATRGFDRELSAAAKASGVRVLGPECLGIMRPVLGLNAACTSIPVKPGRIALVSQSDALTVAILDGAPAANVGFSSVVSLGHASDLDVAEALDFLADDQATESIMLYMEGARDARRFMSALSAACRVKPVVVLKAGRCAIDSPVPLTHSGAEVGADEVFEAAIRRAGAVRIGTFIQFFAAAITLSTHVKPLGNRLAIVSNGSGPGLLAADHALRRRIPLAQFSPETIAALRSALPQGAQITSPLDIHGTAGAQRFAAATRAVLADPGVDGLLVLLSPLNGSQPLQTAHAIIEISRETAKPVLAAWIGDTHMREAVQAFADAQVACVRTPEGGVDAFLFTAEYALNQQQLLQLPSASDVPAPASPESAGLIIEGALDEGRKLLSEVESKALLATFGIPVVPAMIAHSPGEALAVAAQIGFPVAMKVYSPDISHKQEAGGVRLALATPQAVRTAYSEIIAEVAKQRPDARVSGIVVQPMMTPRPHRELMVGINRDAQFGPVVTLGAGGELRGLGMRNAVALPPLNRFLVGRFIDRSAAALAVVGDSGPAREALETLLLQVSEIACELPQVLEMDVNPLLVESDRVIALDARVLIGHRPPNAQRYDHMAIHPYPAHLETLWQLADGTNVLIRPVRPEDAAMERSFVQRLSDQTRYFRFLGTLKDLTPGMLLRFTQFDYDRELALAVVIPEEGREIEIGAGRFVRDSEGTGCEFAIVIADDWHARGIGRKLMNVMMDAARQMGFTQMHGEVLASNAPMLGLMGALGFTISTNLDDPSIKRVAIDL